MTPPCRTDPAGEVLATVAAAVGAFFTPDGQCPARVGTTDTVRLFAGDGLPVDAWDSHASQGCDEPLVWVRPVRRYRSRQFPTPTIATDCDLPRVIAVEIGVAWCAVVDREPRWSDYADEAETSNDVAWRLEEGLCLARRMLRRDGSERQVGIDILTPYGPEGGVVAWFTTLYASF